MRKSMPLQWIEQSEAAQLLSAARFERAARGRRRAFRTTLSDWLERVHALVVPQLPAGWPLLQAQPVLVRRTQGLRVRRDGGYDDYRCSW